MRLNIVIEDDDPMVVRGMLRALAAGEPLTETAKSPEDLKAERDFLALQAEVQEMLDQVKLA